MAGLDIAPIVRTQDFSIMKQNEDNKGLVDQSHISVSLQKQDGHKAQDVLQKDQATWYQKKQDASEEGSNAYHGDGGRKRREQDKTIPSERVVVKRPNQGFDIKI